MSIVKNVVGSIAAILLAITTVSAQEQVSSTPAITVTAVAASDSVRFTAPSTVVQMRLEVYAASGEKAFDIEIRGGNVVDWRLQDGQAQRLADGSYLCVVTTKSLSGRLGQKSGRLEIENKAASLHSIDRTQLTAQQIQAVGPLEENASLTVLNQGETQTATVIAHDGVDGQITRGRGALSFRIGDFFSGKDAEQMRLTSEGNLGIGITNPLVRLDVDGLIRANQGVVFPDGSIQYSASRRTFGAESLRPGQFQKSIGQRKDFEAASTETSGTGTTGKIPKWSDGPNGVLNDSNITETSGAVGINGSPNTSFRLDVNGSVLFRGSNPGFNLVGLRPAGNTWVFQTVDDDGRFRLFGQDNVNPGLERLTINLSTGNFGISNPSPLSKLHIVSASGDLPPRLQSAGTNSFAAGWDFYHGTTGRGYVGVPDPSSAGAGAGEMLLFGGTGTKTSLWAGGVRGLTLDTAGNVGIGVTAPTSKLYVLNSTAGGIAVYAESASGRAVWGKSTGSYGVRGDSTSLEGVFGVSSSAAGVRGVSTSNSGVYGESPVSSLTAGGVYGKGTGSGSIGVIGESNLSNAVGVFGVSTSPAGVGVYARNLGGGLALYTEGNAGQSRDKGGLVKATIHVGQDGGILGCYNGLTNASTGTCGFSTSHINTGYYQIDFGFRIDDRFISVTAIQPALLNTHVGAGFITSGVSNSLLFVSTFITNVETDGDDAGFMILVY